MKMTIGGISSNTSAFSERQWLNLLRQGGYILYARHAEANVGEDLPYLNFENCYTQRNLSLNGRRQAIIYGESLRRLQIPVMSPVLASPFCRNRETAELAFGQGNVQVDPFLVELYKLSRNIGALEQAWILNSFTSYLELPPPQGRNKVVIGHSFPEGIGLGQIPNMGTVIIRPRGRGNGYEVVERITLTELASLLR